MYVLLSEIPFTISLYKVMLNCWLEKPEKRPPFDTLRQDLDDFDISCEDKYSHYDEYVPNYRKTHKEEKCKSKKSGERSDKIKSRHKKKR